MDVDMELHVRKKSLLCFLSRNTKQQDHLFHYKHTHNFNSFTVMLNFKLILSTHILFVALMILVSALTVQRTCACECVSVFLPCHSVSYSLWPPPPPPPAPPPPILSLISSFQHSRHCLLFRQNIYARARIYFLSDMQKAQQRTTCVES